MVDIGDEKGVSGVSGISVAGAQCISEERNSNQLSVS